MKIGFNNVLFFLFCFSPIFSYSQQLFIPISDSYVVKIYKHGDKDSLGNYISKDSLGNTIVLGKFDGIKAVGKWEIFFDNGRKRAFYSYKDGKLNGNFIE